MNDYEKIIEIAIQNNNIFKTKMVVDAGIRKERIRELLEQGTINRIGHGFYSLAEYDVDRYYELQQRCPKAIFSYGTAAYFWELSVKEPTILDCTVPRGYNTSKLNTNAKVHYHYVLQDFFDIGLTEIQSPDGKIVQVYDKERTICDFIRHRKRVDSQLYSNVLNIYFKSREKDLKKLAKYGRIFHIAKELNLYMEVL